MRKIILEKEHENSISFGYVNEDKPIFAKKNGELAGMIVKEKEGWILRIGGNCGSYGYKDTLKKCILYGMEKHDYEFFVEE